MLSSRQLPELGGGSEGLYFFKVGINEIRYPGVIHRRVVTFPAVPQKQDHPFPFFLIEKEMVSWRLLHHLRVNICRILAPGLLSVILLNEKDDFFNDAEDIFPADVNQEQLLVRKLLPSQPCSLLGVIDATCWFIHI